MMKKCRVDKKCGACRYLTVPYEEQLIAKKKKVQALFSKYTVEDVLGMKDPYHYRHKIYAVFGTDFKGHVHAGLYEENSHKPVFTDACLIQNIQANAILKDIAYIAEKCEIDTYDEDADTGTLRYAYLRVSHATKKVLVTIVIGSKQLPRQKAFVAQLLEKHPEIETIVLNFNHGHNSMVLGPKDKVLYGKGYILDTLCGLQFSISAHSFYQVNPVQTEVLYSTAMQMARLNRKDTVLDMCCGIGTISLIAAKTASFVLGVEINPEAIKDAKYNARRNHLENKTDFIAMDAQEFITHLAEVPDVVFLDPPRSGLSESFLHTLGDLGPKKVIYISCNPETQSRDVQILKDYRYKIEKIQPVDMFPFTSHVETVVLMSRKDK